MLLSQLDSTPPIYERLLYWIGGRWRKKSVDINHPFRFQGRSKKKIYKYCARVSELPFPPSRRSFTSYHFIGIGPYFEFLIIIRCGVLIMLFEPWIGSYAEQFFFLVPFAIFHGVIRMLFPLLPLFFPVDTMPLLWWYNSTLRIDTLLQCSMRASRLAETSKYAHSKQRHQIVCAIVNLFLIQSSTQHDGRKMLENATLIN